MKILFNIMIVLGLFNSSLIAQVGISKVSNDPFQFNASASFHLIGDHNSGSNGLGLILPRVENKTVLPLYNTSETDNYGDDVNMEGMIIYVDKSASVNAYTGQRWEDDKSQDNPTWNQSRFLSLGKGNSSGNEKQSVVCVATGCGRSQYLQFSHAIDGVNSYNNLGILREDTTYPLVIGTGSDVNSKFVMTQAGTYRIVVNIPSYVVSLVGLAPGVSYQLYAAKKKVNGSFENILLADVVPNFPGVLGVGGGLNLGVSISSTVALNVSDYVYVTLHSPGLGISVISTFGAYDDGLYNPREIIFTKIN